MDREMKLSIVTTLYKSSSYIEEFLRRATESAKCLVGESYEIILVNDGSPDDSLEIVVAKAGIDSHLKVVDLSRNFGHHKAMMTGIAHAKGERIFLIDSDLEEEPEWLLEFSEKMDNEKCDVVFGVQKSRKGNLFERWSGWMFYTICSILTDLSLPKNLVTARLMTRRYVDALLRHHEREISIGGLFVITGFDQLTHTVTKHSTSESTYSLRHKFSVMINSITSFSNKPLVSIFYIGLVILVFSSIYIAYLILHRMIISIPISGWTSVMASIWFLGGLIVSFIGVIGIYLSKVFTESKQRPYSIVRQVYSKNDK
jgi:putative glycosyltransferase